MARIHRAAPDAGLTVALSFHTLGLVPHRVMATVLALALVSTWSHVSALHIHAYIDHDHPEHHHGLAAHEHEHHAESHAPDGTLRLESCDPGRHTISFVFVCAAPPQADAIDAEFVNSAVPAPQLRLQGVANISDVRVHGPPRLTQTSPRAPPLYIPA